MQSDKKLNRSFLSTKAWEREPVTGRGSADVKRFELPSLERGKLSFSGHERNHLFQNKRGARFQDISSVSGLDTPKDSRTFAIWDFDRDGWQDLVLLNINTPVLSIYRNQLGESKNNSEVSSAMIALQFVGGSANDQPSTQFGCRDGYGVKAILKVGDQTMVGELQCGEGLAAQNSKTMWFGIGENEMVESIEIRWPLGGTQKIENVSANTLVTVFENAEESVDKTGFEKTPYLVNRASSDDAINDRVDMQRFSGPLESEAPLRVYLSMATWCPNCSRELPQLKQLRDRFSDSEVAMVGVPIDDTETDDDLRRYVTANQPPYQLNGQWDRGPREAFKQLITEQFRKDLLPATIVTDGQGRVLEVLAGVPTVSDIARSLKTASQRMADSR